jgi:peptidyl-prolyl cis-trans isomerase D
MLQRIRDNSQSFISKIIIGLIIGVFALFGAESIVGGFFGSNTVVSVNGEDITEEELASNIQTLMANIGAEVANLDDEFIREIALNQLIEDRLLMQAAREAGMDISSASIDRQLLQTPQFQLDGVFNRDLAVRTMAAQGYTPFTYRQALAERMLIGQLANAYASSGFVTSADLQRIAELTSQRRDFRYVSVTPGNRTAGQVISDEDIAAYYENNPGRFMREEQVAVDYLVLDKRDIFDELSVEESQLRDLYEQERERATSRTERRASHILLEVNGRSESDALVLATELKHRLDEGESFEDLAMEYSDDSISALDGGDIGYTDGSVFPDAMEAALRALEEGEVSEPVRSEFGVHLMLLTELDRQEFAPFEEMAERLERDLLASQVESLYFERLEVMANLAFETFDLEDIAFELELDIQESPFFGRGGGGSSVTSNSNVAAAAFSRDVLEDQLNSDVIEIDDNRAVVIHLREHRPSELRPLDDVRSEIASLLRADRERMRAREIGENILTALRSTDEVEELLEQHELQWREHTSVSREDPSVNAEIRQAAFAVQPATGDEASLLGRQLANGTYVVVQLLGIQDGSLDRINDEERQILARILHENAGRNTFDALLENKRSAARIR